MLGIFGLYLTLSVVVWHNYYTKTSFYQDFDGIDGFCTTLRGGRCGGKAEAAGFSACPEFVNGGGIPGLIGIDDIGTGKPLRMRKLRMSGLTSGVWKRSPRRP